MVKDFSGKVFMMGTIVTIKNHEMTILEGVSRAVYTEMLKDASDSEEQIYISWKEDVDFDYGY
ncbi:hypothetical protein CHCC14820_3115 [Bacillus paralicheniformis]|jgi:hypothetical protein|uniref:Uncharacterized protein n=3 Tax=Bacillaceae TaxID=186817 RepID=A0A6I7TI10_9BACI|nr:hypothetical protein SC10_B2orf02463 [Bacillus paralicheniformis]KJD53031.1 hypothetical protein UZ38_34700 [Bacillus amyloliquefaciens]GIN75675.1 hypothetical protein J41TS8_07160 [Bacillus sp. J41TS8]OLF87475.1 hypothetical protein B4121_3927 [Bacillus paralicheniformis]OLG06967.1 hypothetical protein B4125_1148 [Bacillus paralicheniformis]